MKFRTCAAIWIIGFSSVISTFPLQGYAAEPTATELAAARQLFADGKALEKKGDWAGALEKFKKVADVKMTPQVRYHMALCDEHLGKYVSAINGFELAAQEANKAGVADVSENAPIHAQELRKKVPNLRIDVKSASDKTKVILDGDSISSALWGTNIPVDPGTHVIDAEIAGKNVLHKSVKLVEFGNETIEVKEDGSSSAAVAPVPQPEPQEPEPKPTKKEESPPSSTSSTGYTRKPSRVPVYIAAGIGVAGLAAGGVLYKLRQDTIDEVRATCNDDKSCDPDLKPTAEQGVQYTIFSAAAAGVGAAALGTAVVLWFTTSPKKSSAVVVAPTIGGASLSGRF